MSTEASDYELGLPEYRDDERDLDDIYCTAVYDDECIVCGCTLDTDGTCVGDCAHNACDERGVPTYRMIGGGLS